MLEGHDILCFGPGDWWYMNPSCTVHIMRGLSEANRVLYINPFSADVPRSISRGLSKRVLRKARSMLRCLRRESPSLFTFTPLFFPHQGNPWIDRANNLSIQGQIRCLCAWLGMHPSVLWLENARAADAMDWFRNVTTIYHVSDDFAACPYARNRSELARREERLTNESDLLICVSENLYQAKRRVRGASVRYLPHGVDFDRFHEPSRGALPPTELAGIPTPIIGYFGTLTAQNDIGLLEYCASKAPDLSFVFAGTITAGDYRRLQSLPNTHFLGPVPYERIHLLASSFDVCLLPWRLTTAILQCNPLKFMEYMATGRPIVSVALPEVIRTAADVVSIAGSEEAFLVAIRRELCNDTPQRRARRIEIARGHNWTAKVDALSRFISEASNARGQR